MSWVAAGVASGAATMAAVKYVKQKRDNKRDEKNRPMMDVSPSVLANQTMAQQMAMQGMSAEEREKRVRELEQQKQASLFSLSSRKSGIAGVAAIDHNQNAAYRDIGIDSENQKMQNMDRLMNANMAVDDMMAQRWDVNVNRPWYQRSAMRRANDNELSQNLNQAGSMAGGMNFGAKKQQTQQAPQQQQQDYTQAPNQPRQFEMSPYQQQAVYSQSPTQQGQTMDLQGNNNYWNL